MHIGEKFYCLQTLKTIFISHPNHQHVTRRFKLHTVCCTRTLMAEGKWALTHSHHISGIISALYIPSHNNLKAQWTWQRRSLSRSLTSWWTSLTPRQRWSPGHSARRGSWLSSSLWSSSSVLFMRGARFSLNIGFIIPNNNKSAFISLSQLRHKFIQGNVDLYPIIKLHKV